MKVVNRMFMDAEHSFSLLKFYYEHTATLFSKSSNDFHEFTERLEREHNERQQPFDKNYWLKHYDVYSKIYPHFFNNSFIISACAQFEFQIRMICTLVKEEHKVPLEWDDMKGNVPKRAKSFLWLGGILLSDDLPNSFQHWFSVNMPGAKSMTVRELWKELDDYFRVRNCIAHHNGLIQRMRYPERTTSYASRRGILENTRGQPELLLSQEFNKEVCDTMMKFFSKVKGAYYSAPLPE